MDTHALVSRPIIALQKDHHTSLPGTCLSPPSHCIEVDLMNEPSQPTSIANSFKAQSQLIDITSPTDCLATDHSSQVQFVRIKVANRMRLCLAGVELAVIDPLFILGRHIISSPQATRIISRIRLQLKGAPRSFDGPPPNPRLSPIQS